MSDEVPVTPEEPDDERRRRFAIFDRWGKLAVAAVVVLVVGAVGVGAWALGSDNAGTQEVYVEAADSVGMDPFTTSGIDPTPVASESPSTSVASGSSPTTKPALYGGSGDNGVCDPAGLVAFLESHPDKAAAWVAALNADPKMSWRGGRQVSVTQIAAYVAELTPTHLTVDTLVTNHGFENGKPTPRQSLLKAGTAVLVDSHRRRG